MLWLAIGIISAILFLWLLSKTGCKNLPPGPKGLPFIGNLQDLDTNNIHQCLDKLAKKYGPVMYIRVFQRNIVVLSDGDSLRKAFRSAEFRELLNDKPKGFYGTYLVFNHQDVLLGPYSDATFKLKSVMHKGIQPAMKESVLEKEISDLIKRFEATGGKDFEPQGDIRSVLGNVLAYVQYSYPVNPSLNLTRTGFLTRDPNLARPFNLIRVGALATTCNYIHDEKISGDPKPLDSDLMWEFVDTSNRLLSPSVETVLKNFPSLRLFPGKYSSLYSRARESRDAVLQRFLDEYKKTFEPGVTRGIVDTCLNIQYDERDSAEQCWLTDDMVKALILDVIGAGLIATSNTVTGGLLTLFHHQDIVLKMRNELNHVIGKDRLPTGKDQPNLPYCHAVILEIFRYTTVVPIVNHFCSKQDVKFENFTIPKNTIVWGNMWSAHHDEAIFTDPWTFKPDRFLDEKGGIIQTDHNCRQTLFPFGIGARKCVGDDFAKTRLFVYISALVQKFDILPPVEKEVLSCDPRLYRSGAVLQMDNFSCRMIPVA